MTSRIDKITKQLIVLALVWGGSGVAARSQEALAIELAAAADPGAINPLPAPSPAPPAPQQIASGSHSSGSSGGSSQRNAAPAIALPNQTTTRDAVEKLSTDVRNSIANCAGIDNAYVRSCVSDALDGYAAGLSQLKEQLSPQLANLPNIVETAAQRVRAAKTKKQAVQALKFAISAVHKTIALLRADDPVTLAAQTREGNLVAETLVVADNKLEKAVGL